MTVVIVSGLVHRYNKTSFLRDAVQQYSALFFAQLTPHNIQPVDIVLPFKIQMQKKKNM